MHKALLKWESTLKGKNLLPIGSKFFPFKVDPFLERKKNSLYRVASPESVSIPQELLCICIHITKKKKKKKIHRIYFSQFTCFDNSYGCTYT